MGGADGFPLQTEEQGEGQRQKDGSQVPDLLEDKRRTCGEHDLDAGPRIDPQLGDKGTDGHDDQLGRRLYLLLLKDLQRLRPGEDPQDQGVEDGEEDQRPGPDRDLDLPDGVRDHNKNERHDKDLVFCPKP